MKIKTIITIISVSLALLFTACGREREAAGYPVHGGGPTASATQTETGFRTPASTAAPVPSGTAEQAPEPSSSAFVNMEDDCSKHEATWYEEYETAAKAVLRGEEYKFWPYYYGCQNELRFCYDGEDFNEGCLRACFDKELNDTAFSYPPAAAKTAQKLLLDYYEGVIPVIGDYDTPLLNEKSPGWGFGGENWFLIKLDPWHTVNEFALVYLNDDGSCSEIGPHSFKEHPDVIGAWVSDKNNAILCTLSWLQDDGRGMKVYRTTDGGKSWDDLGLKIPDEYEGYVMSAAYAPVFEGEDGVILVTLSYPVRNETDPTVVSCCFLTHNGGDDWEFKELAGFGPYL